MTKDVIHQMEPLSSLAISVLANIATPWITRLLEKGLETRVKDAYVRALRKWTKHDVVWESRKYRERLLDLAEYIENPKGKERCNSDIELLEYYKEELRKDQEVWSIIEESLLANITSILQDTNRQIEEIKRYLEQCAVSQKALTDSVQRLLDLQLRRNIVSGKYLEDTYLEVDELKDKLRFFVDPFLFYQLSCERASRLNFENLRWKLSERNEGGFDFDVSTYINGNESLSDFELLYEASRRLSDYLYAKYKELDGGGNTRYFQSRKVNDIRVLNDCLYKRVFLFTSKAGQGKTNLLCDLTKNVLMRRGVPAAYLNGYELDVINVEESFSHKMFPTKKYSLDEILTSAKCYCESSHKPFIFIIDGLNENAAPRELKSSIETFLSTVLQYDFVKVIISCRTEYYDLHFSSIGKLFESDTIIKRDINNRLQDDWRKLKELYFGHFSIKCSGITDDIKEAFCNNLLLFRIFCEVNEGRQLHVVHSIAKEPMFSAYCAKMISRVSEELTNEGYSLATESFIVAFLRDVVGKMIQKEEFSNIPLSSIWSEVDSQQREVLNRFLDNNVLVRKDLKPDNSSPFKNSEVVNFTFDEFRDYLVSHYLVDQILNDNKDSFQSMVSRFTDESHFLSEGLTTFLFAYVKRIKEPFALQTIKSQSWYNDVFRLMIWDVDEGDIDGDDLNLIKDYLLACDVRVVRYLTFWGRWDTRRFEKLNISLLLDYLSTLDMNGLQVFFEKAWSDKPENYYHWMAGRRDPSPREQLLEQVGKLLENETHTLANYEQRNLYELVLYMAAIDNQARMLYSDYVSYTGDKEQVENVMSATQCAELKEMAKQWI